MIYAKNIQTEQRFLVPKNTPFTMDAYGFIAKSTIDNRQILFSEVSVTDYSADYYKVVFKIEKAPNNGEYVYMIYNDTYVVASGIMILSAEEQQPVVIEYDADKKYIQYE